MFDTFQQKFNGFQSLKCKSFDTEFMTENHAIHNGGRIPTTKCNLEIPHYTYIYDSKYNRRIKQS